MQCKQFCQELQAAVEKGNGYVVGGRFTYADITMVVALNILSMLRKPYARYTPPGSINDMRFRVHDSQAASSVP